MSSIVTKTVIGFAAAGLALVGVTASANATDTTTVQPNLGEAYTARPSHLTVALADGGDYLTGIHWTAWTGDYAKGVAVEHLNTCRPDCASGHFKTRPVHVLLDNVSGGHFHTVTVITRQDVTPRP